MNKFLISIGVWLISISLGNAVGIQIAQLIGLVHKGADQPNLMVIYPIFISTCVIFYFLQKKVLSYIDSSDHIPDTTQNLRSKDQPEYKFTNEIETKPFLNFLRNISIFSLGVFVLILVVKISRDYEQKMTVQHFGKPSTQKISPEQKHQKQTIGYKSYIKNGNYENAIESLNRFLNLRSNSPYLRKTILIQRGDLYMVTNKYQEAIDDYTESFEIIRHLQNSKVPENQTYIDEGSSLCLLKRGTAYRTLGLFDQAIKDLSAAIAENPSERILKDCYLQRGLTYKTLGNEIEFANDFKKLIEHGYNLVEGFYALDDNRWLKYGKFTWYYEDGTPEVKCNYQNDEIIGACKYFKPDRSVK